MLNADDRQLRNTCEQTKMYESVSEDKEIMLPVHANENDLCVWGQFNVGYRTALSR